MNDDIQVGDTVEVLKDGVGLHPTENRWLKAGDRVVLCGCHTFYVEYCVLSSSPSVLRSTPLYLIDKRHVKKVNPNHVEVKFR
jgi:hypothetical protein